MLAVPRFIQFELLVQLLLIQVGEERHAPAQEAFAVLVNGRRWEMAVHIMIVVHREPKLLEVVLAAHAVGSNLSLVLFILCSVLGLIVSPSKDRRLCRSPWSRTGGGSVIRQ